jgi:hypothetical protein
LALSPIAEELSFKRHDGIRADMRSRKAIFSSLAAIVLFSYSAASSHNTGASAPLATGNR